MLALQVANRTAVEILMLPSVLIGPAVAIAPEIPTVPPVVPQVVTATPAVLIPRPIAVVPSILSIVATVLSVTLRLRVLPLVTVLLACRIARALIGSRRRRSYYIAWSARALRTDKRHCRCERRADGHRQEATVFHDTSSFFADQ